MKKERKILFISFVVPKFYVNTQISPSHTCSRIQAHIHDMGVEVKLSGVPKEANRKKEGLREGRTGRAMIQYTEHNICK